MYEINLVPDIKNEMLKKQRLSNLLLFIALIVMAASAGIVLIFGSIVVDLVHGFTSILFRIKVA